MYRRCIEMHRIDQNIFLRSGLCLVWAAGLSLGFAADRFYGDTLQACVLLAANGQPDLLGCLAVNVLPLMISAFAVFFFPFLYYPLCFLRGLCLGLSLGAVAAAFGSAGHMMSGLLMFSSICFTPVLLWYWQRRLELGAVSFRSDTLVCLVIGLVTSGVDFGIVSPFLREIMNF